MSKNIYVYGNGTTVVKLKNRVIEVVSEDEAKELLDEYKEELYDEKYADENDDDVRTRW